MSRKSREQSKIRQAEHIFEHGEYLERMMTPRSQIEVVEVPQAPRAERCADCELAVAIVRRLHPSLDTRWSPMTRDVDVDWDKVGGSPTDTLHAYDSQCPDSYHLRFGDRIRWHRAWDPPGSPPLVYLAHPVSGDFKGNVASARRWLRFLRGLTLEGLRALGPTTADLREVPFIGAPWLAEPFNGDADPKFRARHLAGCYALASRHDEVWVAVRWSHGVAGEARASRKVRDLTHLGPTPWAGRRQ